ncbi:MAG: ACT domain-containing protein [Nocardioidaceae bacterium]|nr:ACT domain-containing protein [Nocardioidaceae bacterium]
MTDAFELTRHVEHLAVVRLGPGADVPDWAATGTLFSVTATRDETSVVCGATSVPRRATSEGPFVAFEVAGPLDFALTGVLGTLLAPLADAEISVFTLSTYDTDWILVPAKAADAAAAAWQDAGHTVTDEEIQP